MKVVCINTGRLEAAGGRFAVKKGLVEGKTYYPISTCKSEDGIHDCYYIGGGLGKVRVERFSSVIEGNIVDIPIKDLLDQSIKERKEKEEIEYKKKYTAQFRIVTAKKIVTKG